MKWKASLVHRNLAVYDTSNLLHSFPAQPAKIAEPDPVTINWFSEISDVTCRTTQAVTPTGACLVAAHFTHIMSLMLPHADHWKPAMR